MFIQSNWFSSPTNLWTTLTPFLCALFRGAWNQGNSIGSQPEQCHLLAGVPEQALWLRSLFPHRSGRVSGLQELHQLQLHQPKLKFTEEISLAPQIDRSWRIRLGNSAEKPKASRGRTILFSRPFWPGGLTVGHCPKVPPPDTWSQLLPLERMSNLPSMCPMLSTLLANPRPHPEAWPPWWATKKDLTASVHCVIFGAPHWHYLSQGTHPKEEAGQMLDCQPSHVICEMGHSSQGNKQHGMTWHLFQSAWHIKGILFLYLSLIKQKAWNGVVIWGFDQCAYRYWHSEVSTEKDG